MLRFRFLPCILLMLLVSASFSATKPPPAKPPPAESIPKVVRAQTFELTDAAGKTRAWLGTLDDGTTVLKLLDGEGKPKVIVDSNGEIMVLDDEGKTRVTTGTVEGEYGIAVFDSKGTMRADVRLDSTDSPSVTLRDSTGMIRGSLLTLEDEPILALWAGKDDGARLALQVTDSLPMLSLWDTAGKPRASYSLTDSGGPLFQMLDADGKSLAEISTAADQPSLILQSQRSKISAFFGFTEDADVSLMMLNDQDHLQVGMGLNGADPSIAIRHPNGEAAAGMWISDEGIPYFATDDADGLPIWGSPEE